MKIGILGAGQLSRMLALAGMPLGIEFVFLAPEQTACVKHLGAFVQSAYTDESGLKQLADQVDVVTYENENIPVASLEYIKQHVACYPDEKAIAVMQDRWLEKSLFTKLSIPTTNYCCIDSVDALMAALPKYDFKGVLKTRCEGYDGKGQVVIRSQEDIAQLTSMNCQGYLLENLVPFEREISIVAVRALSGECRFYDLNINVHRSGVLYYTSNAPDDAIFAKACDYMQRILAHLNYVGVCALEFFQVGDELIANEMAPRVHNTGHWTIEGAVTSQFENHIRAVIGLPLGDTASVGPAMMFNILSVMPDRQQLLAIEKLHLHDYQKSPRPSRKLGHVTGVGLSDLAISKARKEILA
jgi:5-(carboxyamino)imidazole ribonucleotide synthase